MDFADWLHSCLTVAPDRHGWVATVQDVHRRTFAAAQAAFAEGDQHAAAELHRAAAGVFLARFADPLCSTDELVEGPLVEAFLSTLATEWFAEVDRTHADVLAEAPVDSTSYCDWLTGIVSRARCTAVHPLFEHLERHAPMSDLALLLQAENLCDLHFADILALLLPGLRGRPKLEVAENFWDEIGHGVEDRIHRNLRMEMMAEAGLATDASSIAPERTLVQELEHFNAYCLSSHYRRFSPRLVGMLLATEVLVPAQLQRVISGWRRVGFDDRQMRYLLEHVETDVKHGDGWVERVVRPVLESRPGAGPAVAAGALHHLEILSRLYDDLLCMMTSTG